MSVRKRIQIKLANVNIMNRDVGSPSLQRLEHSLGDQVYTLRLALDVKHVGIYIILDVIECNCCIT